MERPAPLRRLALEWTILRSSVAPRPEPRPAGAAAFGYVAESSVKLVVLAYPLVLLGDLLFTEAIIPARLVGLRAVLAALGVYGFFWLLGVYRTMRAQPHFVAGGVAHLRRGALASAAVPLDAIESVARLEADAKPTGRPARLDAAGAPKLLVTTKVPVVYRGSGGTQEVTRLLVSADDPAAFATRLLAG